jgi:hypothetical protein
MRKLTIAFLLTCLSVALGAVQPASAQTPSAYLLAEIAAGSDPGAALEALRGLSLMNCLQLVESLVPGEAIVHVACNDLASLNQAIGDFATVENIARVTVWTVKGAPQ